jgi:hypothetical protein
MNTPEDVEKYFKARWEFTCSHLVPCKSPQVVLHLALRTMIEEFHTQYYPAWVKSISVNQVVAYFHGWKEDGIIDPALEAAADLELVWFSDQGNHPINPTGINPMGWQPVMSGVAPNINLEEWFPTVNTSGIIFPTFLITDVSHKISLYFDGRKTILPKVNRWDLEI